jgi:hypothetical protein
LNTSSSSLTQFDTADRNLSSSMGFREITVRPV